MRVSIGANYGYIGNTKDSEKYERFIKNTNEPIALVFGLDINGLGVVRSLGRRGIPVIAIDPNRQKMGRFSRYCKAVICPDPKQQEEDYVNLLLALGKMMNSKGVIIQSEEADILTILKHKNELEKYYRIPMADFDIIEALVDKGKFYKMLEELNMPHPKTFFPNDIFDVKKISREITYPYIVKPIFSPDFNKEFHVKVFKASSTKELINAYDKATSNGHKVVIQEVIPGDDNNIYGFGSYMNKKFELKGAIIYKKIRGYPKGFGNCSLIESTWEPEILKLSLELLGSINYYGISEIEFKRDIRDNSFKIIEMNARTWWQNRLASRCGADLPFMAYIDALHGKVDEIISKKEGVKWLYMFSDLRSSFESIMKGELSLVGYINSLRGEKEYAIFAWDDPLPFFAFFYYLAYAVLMNSVRHLFYGEF